MQTEFDDVVIQAVVFDIGGVLERVDDPGHAFGAKWRERLGLSDVAFEAALAGVDPDFLNQVGRLTEAQFRDRSAAALGLSELQADEYIADVWDWHCGELDVELHEFALSLRPALRTAILSNSGAGARREEQARYQFEDHFDPIIYSHEVGLAKPDPVIYELTCAKIGATPGELIFIDNVPANVEAAARLGIRAILHESTPRTIAEVRELIGS
jgi:epoxide hydrolase-like predicted phosphatase